jgi:hypothetical protein
MYLYFSVFDAKFISYSEYLAKSLNINIAFLTLYIVLFFIDTQDTLSYIAFSSLRNVTISLLILYFII